ncbi:phosphoglycerate dehydrogenase [Occallatibacter riparius]|uniref:Phosphoglycerate dehydrogenase n=1 Tax=Occallatibacter riparius TaxID=1002689 RepID=A0A9J7BTD4_9BACT|nr:phosphoglycerate dehydrogenase [Occallatibacter riparius]UWZ86132.1 phosphoglycerate dehydrogenase [Occallatibacter riparius]
MSKQVLVSSLMMLKERARFESEMAAKGWTPVFADVDQFLSEEQCLQYAGRFDAWLAGDDRITRNVLSAFLPRLKGIAKWGTGVDSIDLAAARELQVPVLNTAGAFSEAVSEVALGYMLMLTRHLLEVDRAVRNGEWPKPCGLGLYGRVCGLIGFGAIGQGIARRAKGCGMSILAYDPPLRAKGGVKDGPLAETEFVDLNRLVAESDIVCLACNLTPENRHMIGEKQLKAMKNDAILVNVGRGPLVDETALIAALTAGEIAGAGLDVFEVEPLPAGSPLRRLPHVVLGSHNANNLHSAVEYVHSNTMNNLARILGQ